MQLIKMQMQNQLQTKLRSNFMEFLTTARIAPDAINTRTNKPYTFFGRLWRNSLRKIASQISEAVSSIIPGPVGSVLGDLLEKWALKGVDIIISKEDFSIALDTTPIWETHFNDFVRLELLPALGKISERIDAQISTNLSFKVANDLSVIEKINESLKDVATLKAYADHLDAHSSDSPINDYKVAALLEIIPLLEKAIIIYAEKNAPNYELVQSLQVVSNVNTIETIKLNFGNTTIESQVKKYISKGTQTQDDNVITDVNTDVDITPVLTPQDQAVANQTIVKPNNSKMIIKVLKTAGLLYIGKKTFNYLTNK